MKTKAVIPALFTLLTSGCVVGPDYQPPNSNMPAQWSDASSKEITHQNDQPGDWWKLFHDDKLNSLIERAVKANLDLHIAESRVRQARAQQGFAEADLWPTLSASGSYARQKQSEHQPILGSLPKSSNIPFENDVYKAGFDATWEIDLFGGKRRAVEAATAALTATEYGRRDVLVSLLSEVARYYALTRGAQRQLAILQNQINAQEETVNIIRSRVNHGTAAELELQRSIALLASIESQAPAIETSIQSSIHRLGVLLAQSPNGLNAELAATAAIPAPPPQVPVGLPSDLLRRRPDVLQAERLLAAETARIGQVKAELFPKFSLTGSLGAISISPSDFFLPGSRTWSIGPTVQWRIFDSGRVLANINAQTEAQDQALLNYQKIVLTSFEEVENALVAYAKEQEHYRLLEQEVSANQTAADLAKQRYVKGWSSYLDLLDAQRTLYVSQDERVRSERTVTLNLVALYKALGGGWEMQESVP
ncbi:efflux transporter outer membrane subunit [Methylomonas sp. UP202]|uniref:efflux transporter outer membrane subunit n=1 Tax=Methylomonas sp. UP202 TaxID=3040943 RepID=UPI00247A5713|nr:efflux transporter outer membrane subunit [Methylomonas sp. UP202]WGS84029.1 efflux transporter outer membrane subunit [Methylomonas sp. UP202]